MKEQSCSDSSVDKRLELAAYCGEVATICEKQASTPFSVGEMEVYVVTVLNYLQFFFKDFLLWETHNVILPTVKLFSKTISHQLLPFAAFELFLLKMTAG